MLRLSRNKTNPVKDIWYFIKVAVFFVFNNCGWTQGTAHDIKWTLRSTRMKFQVIHPHRALQAIASVGAHCQEHLTRIFFKLSSLAKSEFWDNLPFYPQTKWLPQQKIFWHLAMGIEVAILKIIPSMEFKPTQLMFIWMPPCNRRNRILPLRVRQFCLWMLLSLAQTSQKPSLKTVSHHWKSKCTISIL